MIEKADQVRAQVQKNADAFSKEEVDKVMALYPTKDAFGKLLEEDAERFKLAVEKTGAPLTATEPVTALAQRFEAEVDLKQAAAELGLPPAEFLVRLEKDAQMARLFGALRIEGGTVQRELLAEEFSLLVSRLEAGVFVDQFRPQTAGPDPAAAPTEKRPFNVSTLTVTVPQVGSNDKVHSFRIETFLDKERKNWIHLSETGSLAVSPQTKELDAEGKVGGLYSTELRARKVGETDFTDNTATHTIAVKHDGLSDSLIYVSDTGSIAVAKAKVPTGAIKNFTHLTSYGFNVRKAGESEIDGNTPAYSFEIFRDENTGLLLFVSADGTIAVTSGDHPAAGVKYSPYLHAFACKSRKADEADFTAKTGSYGIELWKDRTSGFVYYASQIGSMAVTTGKVTPESTVPPTWITRIKIGVRKDGEGSLPNDNRMGSVEVYRDENSGNFIYLCETGHLAVLPGRKEN
jgi:hypothetical protein